VTTAPAGALAYLIARTMRNRIISMAKRLRQPRYAIGFVFVAGYFGLMVWSTGLAGRSPAPATPAAGLLGGDTFRIIAPAALALFLLPYWFTDSALLAIAFSRPEVAMLFPAPVSRRALLLYKIVRVQVATIISVTIIVLLWGRGLAPGAPHWMAAIGLFTLFATMHLHRMGAALVQVAAIRHGRSALKRNWLSQLVGLVVTATVISVIASQGFTAAGDSPAGPLTTFLNGLTAALSQPWVRVVLSPFALVVAPAFARSATEWWPAFAGAVGVLALHLVWVLRSHAAFEEAAAEQSTKLHAMIEQFRKRGFVEPERKIKRRLTIPLAPGGHPAVALVWKNSLNFVRTFRPLQLAMMLLVPLAAAGYFGWKSGDVHTAVAGISALFALILLVAGGTSVRNDLRADLLNLSSLKTMPLRGSTLVLAEVASSALPLAAIQCLLLWVAALALQMSRTPMPSSEALALVATLPFGLIGLNLLGSTIRNGVALVFPAWVRLGADGGGIETAGQAMLGMLVMFVAVVGLLVVPAGVTLALVLLVRPPPAVATAVGVVLGAAVVVAECHVATLWLGRVLERTEPSAVAAS